METLSAKIIPAFTQMPIRMVTSTTGGNRPATNLNCMATILSSEFPQLGGGYGWVVPNHAGHITMVVFIAVPWICTFQEVLRWVY